MRNFLERYFSWCKPLLVFAAAALLSASLTPYAAISNLLTDTPSHFPIWILLAAALLLLAVWVLKAHKSVMIMTFLSIIAAMIQVYPYLPTAGEETNVEQTFKLLQINVYTNNVDTRPLQDLITAESPDAVMIAEINSAFIEMGNKITKDYPYQFYARDTAILSRVPLRMIKADGQAYGLSVPQFFVFDLNGHKVTLATLHTAPPPVKQKQRDAELDQLAKTIASLKQAGEIGDNMIFGGDINITPYAPAYKKFIRDTALRNAREGIGLRHSWPVWLPLPLRIPIDHVLVGGNIRVIDYRVGPDVASDHLPTIAVLAFP